MRQTLSTNISTSHHLPARTMASLSDDMILEILTHLPFKPLSRFKCVSKPWHRLISDECRRRRQVLSVSGVFRARSTAADTSPCYGTVSDGHLRDCDLSVFPFYENSELVDFCNGMLLFVTWNLMMFHVCCPETGKWAPLPKPRRRVVLSVLAFDPSRSSQYKVLCFTGWRDKGAELEVFSSDTGKWTEQEVHWGIENDAISATMRYFDGALHILAYPQQMVFLDLETMTSSLIDLPEPVSREGSMGMSGGRLHYTSNDIDGGEIRVWAMEDSDCCSSKWALKHCINNVFGNSLRCFSVLAFHPEAEVVYMRAAGKLVAYYTGTKRFDEFCEIGKDMDDANVVEIWLYSFSQFMSDCLIEKI